MAGEWHADGCDSKEGHAQQLSRYSAALESCPEVELWIRPDMHIPAPWLLRGATHIQDSSGQDFLSSPFRTAVACSGVPRMRSMRCLFNQVTHLPPILAKRLQELKLGVRYDGLDSVLMWPPGWLPSLHTMVLFQYGSIGSAADFSAAHVAALAAAAPGLRVLDVSAMWVVDVSLHLRSQLQAALPALQLVMGKGRPRQVEGECVIS